MATKVVCFSRLLKCLRSLYSNQCGLRSDCSYRSSLLWVHAVCFYTSFVSNARQFFAADDFSRRHFQMHFFLGALRVKILDVLRRITRLSSSVVKNQFFTSVSPDESADIFFYTEWDENKIFFLFLFTLELSQKVKPGFFTWSFLTGLITLDVNKVCNKKMT